jgi:ABC-type polysaccharide/polyol phosphate transport system ATPase subunit
MNQAIRAENLTKLYRRSLPGDQLRTLKSALIGRSLTRGLKREEAITALRDVSFQVTPGEALGVIGSNGSGKSTLLKLVAGILKPSDGRVEVTGRVAALIELGAGFHPEISGRENIYINGAVLGLSRREIERRFDDIVEFSGLEEFIDEPVKNYSSGMYVRLGFAVAIHTDPDVLLVDEVLAVGDEAYAHRCLRRIEEFLAAGKTVLFVSHALDLVESLCDRALWLHRGSQRLVGIPRRVADAYREAVAEEEGQSHRQAKEIRERSPQGSGERWGSREAEILEVRLLRGSGQEAYRIGEGETVTFEIRTRATRPLTDFVFGIGIWTPRGVECWGVNTHLAGLHPLSFEGEGVVRLTCPELRLAAGEYLLDVAVHSQDGVPYDYRRHLLSFTVTSSARGAGVYSPRHSWEFSGAIEWRH